MRELVHTDVHGKPTGLKPVDLTTMDIPADKNFEDIPKHSSVFDYPDIRPLGAPLPVEIPGRILTIECAMDDFRRELQSLKNELTRVSQLIAQRAQIEQQRTPHAS